MLAAIAAVCLHVPLPKEPEWSKPVAGLAGRIEFERKGEKDGTPKLVPYLLLKNVTDSLGTVDVWLSHSNLKLRLVDAKGAPIKDQNPGLNGRNGFVPNPFWLMIPFDSTVRMNAGLNGYFPTQPGALLLETESALLYLPKGFKGEAFLTGTFEVTETPREARSMRWEGKMDLPPVKIWPFPR